MMQTTQDIVQMIESDNLDTVSMLLRDLVKTHRLGEGNSLRQMYKRYMLKSVPIYERKPLAYEKIDRRTANDFYGDIVDTKTGYMGNSVSVDLDRSAYERDGVFDEADYEDDLKWLNDFSLDNDSEDRNSELVRMAAMCGKAYRQLYFDADANIKIQNLDPWEVIYIKDHSLDEPQLVLRYYEMTQMDGGNKKVVTVVEWYDETSVRYYIDNGDLEFKPYREEEWRDNLFSRIPILLFKNNEYETAEPYKVTDLMDAYDAIISATTSEIEQLRLAYMFIKDSGLYIDKKFMESLEQTGIFPLSENGEVGFINKQLADAPVNNLLAEIRRNIYQFAKSIDMSKDFGGEMRVIGWQVALLNLENSCKITERKFRRGLREQYRIITDHWREFKGVDIDVNEMEFTFTRNFPKDIKAEAETLQLLLNSVSTKTAFAQMSFIDQPEKEIERIEQERDPFRGVDDERSVLSVGMEPAAGDVQKQALNGAQIKSLLDIAVGVSEGVLPKETAIEIILASIPGMSDQDARDIINPITEGSGSVNGRQEPEAEPTAQQQTVARQS